MVPLARVQCASRYRFGGDRLTILFGRVLGLQVALHFLRLLAMGLHIYINRIDEMRFGEI